MQRVRRSSLLAMLGLAFMCAAPVKAALVQTELYATAGPFPVDTAEYEWRDAHRQRDIPVKIYMPRGGSGPFPVIIYSHGLGGSREGYEYLGRHWAGHGFVSVHPTHAGSDSSVLKRGKNAGEAMVRAADDPQNAINRPRDIGFVIDRLTSLSVEAGPLEHKLDLGRIGVAGHSFGGFTALAVAGQTFIGPMGRAFNLTDRRVKAVIAMSAPANQRSPEILQRMYGSIRIPCMLMTGTYDHSPIGTCTAQERRIPFDHMNGIDAYLLTLAGGDHMIFSGRRFDPNRRERDKRFHELILASSTAFWEAYLRDDATAKGWLTDSFAADLDIDGTFEIKQQ